MLHHPFEPIINNDSRVLVLGSFPSVKSRENSFYYGHPQNRFWPMLAMIFRQHIPLTIQEKTELLHQHRIALWDVIERCEPDGSMDSSIRDAHPNDISSLLKTAPIERVLLNGQLAGKLYLRYFGESSLHYHVLPSTSPANAAWSLQRLADAWQPFLL